MIEISIPGKPIGKGRPRFNRNGHAYTPRETRDHEALIAWHAKAAMNRRAPLDGPVEARMLFVLPDRRRRDIDNLLKLGLDAMNGIVYADDTQVHRIEATKQVGDEPYTEITITPM
ncbi:RusA family crossover junction endodeoxyribonuclease [uncultured Stenotrophomonas sp.]|uniref:RusA family crossover junction endodeoxyribonuclease n=1 Tax=uncultured Stenotrophomonas sp. TaxID=165438 RepID=UPI0025DD3135|nr:RusA family crossover junction endodeoxyribonuclease [uncultured Stenotrophomonas sp.]